jgi:hypothetical protein
MVSKKEGKATSGKPPATKRDDPAQSERFINAAREAEADETREGAERAFKKVVGSKSDLTKKARGT